MARLYGQNNPSSGRSTPGPGLTDGEASVVMDVLTLTEIRQLAPGEDHLVLVVFVEVCDSNPYSLVRPQGGNRLTVRCSAPS